MKQVIALSIIFFLVTGCATQGQQARTEGTAGGAGIGAVLGGLIGYMVDDESGALIGAGLGALLGGAAGYTYADRIAKRHEVLAGRENDLDARLSFAEGVNSDTQKYNQQLESEIAALAPEIDALIAQAQHQQITQQELERERQTLNQKVRETEAQLSTAENELKDLKRFQARTPDQSDDLDTEIAGLEENLKQLKRNTNALASLSQKL